MAVITVIVQVTRSGWILKELDEECNQKTGVTDDPKAFGLSEWKTSWWIAEMVRTEGQQVRVGSVRPWKA